MKGFRNNYGLTVIMLGGLLVVDMVRILLFYIINEAWKYKTTLLMNLFYLDSGVIYTDEEMNFSAHWVVGK